MNVFKEELALSLIIENIKLNAIDAQIDMYNMFGQQAAQTTPQSTVNPMNDFEVVSPPDDSISSLAFSPAYVSQNLLVAGSWDSHVRCWEVEKTGKTVAKAMQSMTGPILDVCWSDDGTKVFMASCDQMVKCWDLASNQSIQVAAHDAPVKTCHWIKGSSYSCLMTGSWDKTLKFWDLRTPTPMLTLNLPEKCYCAAVEYPIAVVGTAGRWFLTYKLEGQPTELSRKDSIVNFQSRCVAIYRDKKKAPTSYAVGTVAGCVGIKYLNSPKDTFRYKCHRSLNVTGKFQDINMVNDLAFHPVNGTLATVGGDGTFGFWDINARTKIKVSKTMGKPITSCCFDRNGEFFAYSVSYDWSKGHEHYNPKMTNHIFLRSCSEDLKLK
ncbi:mRNA export factor-like [Copidosoma floridanum]|uniref:mRNA export factor-like n=1 Tax=Copidosoma floridanum TaxID=29053 RepID=UPI000C6FBF01|nr:mRNA export factor-like [Copidosoma floridanum]